MKRVNSLQELLREALIMAVLDHPNVVRFMGVSFERLAIITKLYKNGSLASVLKKVERSSGTVSLKRRVALILQAARGMNYLQLQCILHGDLRSLNILVDVNWNLVVRFRRQ